MNKWHPAFDEAGALMVSNWSSTYFQPRLGFWWRTLAVWKFFQSALNPPGLKKRTLQELNSILGMPCQFQNAGRTQSLNFNGLPGYNPEGSPLNAPQGKPHVCPHRYDVDSSPRVGRTVVFGPEIFTTQVDKTQTAKLAKLNWLQNNHPVSCQKKSCQKIWVQHTTTKPGPVATLDEDWPTKQAQHRWVSVPVTVSLWVLN